MVSYCLLLSSEVEDSQKKNLSFIFMVSTCAFISLFFPYLSMEEERKIFIISSASTMVQVQKFTYTAWTRGGGPPPPQWHGLVAEKAKPRRSSTAVGGPRHQDHAKMNARILGNVMTVQRRNDQKVTSRAHAKAQDEWKNLVAIAKQCPPFPNQLWSN
jgi:hypothetical protein